MKEIRELKFEELTLEQKLGLVHTPAIHPYMEKEPIDYIVDMVRRRAVGIVWVKWQNTPVIVDAIKRLREAADYPLVLITDAENGLGEYRIGQHGALGMTDSEAHAYAFGKAIAIEARKFGYDMLCGPVLDIKETGWSRCFGNDRERILRLAKAEMRGMHDGGILNMGKHYPSAEDERPVDTHMVEAISTQTEEELLERGLYSYIELTKEGLLDSVMPEHHRLINIDDQAPASLSKKVLSLLRKQGFDGVMMTDALCMMGIRAKYGRVDCQGLAVEAGEDAVLVFDDDIEFNQNALNDCYERGIISDEALDEAVKRILALQHKALMNKNVNATLTDEEKALAKDINKAGIYAIVDEGTPLTLDPKGKYYFALMVRNDWTSEVRDGIPVDTFTNGWHFPTKIKAKILELFPNSFVDDFFEFPTAQNGHKILNRSLNYDETIFITFSENIAYIGGEEHLTYRVRGLINGMQHTDRIGTIIHFGNPKVLEEIDHIPRRIFGSVSKDATFGCIEVLAGLREPTGSPCYELNLK